MLVKTYSQSKHSTHSCQDWLTSRLFQFSDTLCKTDLMALRVTRNFLDVERIALPSGVYVERSARVEVDDHPEAGYTLSMEMEFDENLHRLVSRSVQVLSPAGLEVTGTTLRAVRVQDLLQQAGLLVLTKLSEGDHGTEIKAGDILRGYAADAELHRKSPAAVATIYEVATVLNYPPLKTISELLLVSQSTATRLVAKARELGLLRSGDG